jgi:nucleoside-triphosphatase
MGRTILLTGRPGVGKTTIIREIAAQLGHAAGGFYTAEIREAGRRRGFRIVTLDGKEGILAHVDLKSQPCVSRYGVNLKDLEEIGVAALLRSVVKGSCVVVDEIGKMELFSQTFRDAVLAAVEAHSPVVGTVMKSRSRWTDALKALPQVTILEVTEANRDLMARRVLKMLDTRQGTAPRSQQALD